MPWRDPGLPSEVRDAIYDSYVQGTRLRAAGWSVEQVKTEGFKEILVIPSRSIWERYRTVIEAAFWQGFENTTDSRGRKA